MTKDVAVGQRRQQSVADRWVSSRDTNVQHTWLARLLLQFILVSLPASINLSIYLSINRKNFIKFKGQGHRTLFFDTISLRNGTMLL